MDNTESIIQNIGRLAKRASYALATSSHDEKNQALKAIAEGLHEHRSSIKAENFLDLKNAKEAGLPSPMIERLTLDDKRIDSMIKSVREIAAQGDPIGKLITQRTLENGLQLRKIRVPLGVIAIVFESRPNIIPDVAALCIKSGNAVILRGGKEAVHTNNAIMKTIDLSLQKIEFIPFAVQMVPIQDRAAVTHLCRLEGFVDVIIPRGGEALIKAVSDCATVPVIKHYKGICHVYVDENVDEEMALSICHNAKCQRPSVCNAAETFLIHERVAESFLPKLFTKLEAAGVEMRGDQEARRICPNMKAAVEQDWSEEYLDLIVAIKVVNSVGEAINHINTYGSHHSDAIVSNDKSHQLRFTKEVDSAAVYINASTRFTDGGLFGLGAEMGISTDKLHARGPMGAEELTTYKWVGTGSGHIVEYSA